jgi:hypothetical protein
MQISGESFSFYFLHILIILIIRKASRRGGGLSKVRLQWDPHHRFDGSPSPKRRAIQLGACFSSSFFLFFLFPILSKD